MHPMSHLRRAAAPAIVTGLFTTSIIGAVAPSASALDVSPHQLALLAPAAVAIAAPGADLALDTAHSAAQGAPTAPKSEGPQPLLPRVRLKAKPAPWVLPVVGYHLTGRFGQVSGLWNSFHTGLDFAAPEGTQIHSIGPGTVVSTAYDGAYGNKTVVRLDDGTVLWYCHQSAFGVHPGQRVRPDDLIGYVGSTGNTTGPHLHLEVHPHGGDAIDPEDWLPEHHLHP
jgi:murein DD-endopeptidase MepM/ murein hydrolase activator NlpD